MGGESHRPRTRDPVETRRSILDAAFGEFYARGFQGTGLDAIVSRAGVTTGALYHHFPDKAALGYAVVEEVIRGPILEAYLGPLREAGDPLAALQDTLRRRADDFVDIGIRYGCPLNNLTQEMVPLDDGFRDRVAATLREWTDGIADALRSARDRGHMCGTCAIVRAARMSASISSPAMPLPCQSSATTTPNSQLRASGLAT